MKLHGEAAVAVAPGDADAIPVTLVVLPFTHLIGDQARLRFLTPVSRAASVSALDMVVSFSLKLRPRTIRGLTRATNQTTRRALAHGPL